MQRARLSRFIRALRTSALVSSIALACTVADKGDYTFGDDADDGAGGEDDGRGGGSSGSSGNETGGSSGNGGTTGTGGNAGEAGADQGGSTATGGGAGDGMGGSSAGESGEGGEATGGSAQGGNAQGGNAQGGNAQGGNAGTVTCGNGTQETGEECDDNNRVNEECRYGTACSGCSDRCKQIRAPVCGDNSVNGVTPTSFVIDYLATACGSGVPAEVPLYLNGVRIPGLVWGTLCACQPGAQNVTVTAPEVLAALRQYSNVLSLLGTTSTEHLAWALVTVTFSDGSRVSRTAYDYGTTGDADARNPGPAACTFPPSTSDTFFGWGISDGQPFGGFPVEHCDGGMGCDRCGMPQCVTLTSSESALIPDAGSLDSRIWVPQLGTIRDVDVTIKIDHALVGDLSIALRSPNTAVTLANRRGAMGSHYTDTTFDSECTTPISQGTPPFTGCFAPDAPLSAFNGIASSIGPWSLVVKDESAGIAGRLSGWSLKICGTP